MRLLESYMFWKVNSMKRIIFFILVLLLAACKPAEETEQILDFSFNENTYTYSGTTKTGYDQYVGDGHLIEIMCEEECIISFEMGDDIYFITGTSSAYDITKNGVIILIDGENQSPTGVENPEWNEDILPILQGYEK